FHGIDSTGATSYELEGPHAGQYFISEGGHTNFYPELEPRVLPRIFLTSDAQQDDTYLMAADTGQRTAATTAAPFVQRMYLDDDVLMQQEKSEGEDTCHTVATRSDGKQLWQAQTPCFDSHPLTFVSGRVYGPTDPET